MFTHFRRGRWAQFILGATIALSPSLLVAQENSSTLSVSSTDVSIDTAVVISWNTGDTGATRGWVGVYPPSTPDEAYVTWKGTQGKTGSVTFRFNEPGTYEFRYFEDKTYNRIAQSEPVRVSAQNNDETSDDDDDGGPTDSITLTVASSTERVTGTTSGGGGGGGGGEVTTLTVSTTTVVAPGNVVVSWDTDVTLNKAWIGLYRTGASDRQFLTYKYVSGSSGSETFSVPSAGTYEFRMFNNDRYDRLSVSERVTGTGTGGDTGRLIVSPLNPVVGETFTVRWENIPDRKLLDWIGLYIAGTPDSDYINRERAFFRSSVRFTAEEAGVYEVRYSTDGRVVARAPAFSVADTLVNPSAVRNFPPSGTKAIAFGDSLTAGVGASSLGTNYVGRLSARLGTPIENAGVSGDTTADARARLERDVLSKNPDLVIVFLGGNDLLQNVPTSQTTANLADIISRIQAQGAIVVLVGIEGGVYTDRFANMYRTLAAEYRTAYVPNVLRGIIGNPRLLADLVHPNDTGYELVAARIEPTVRVLLTPVL